ncbi:hypothetical protein THASP1DRAFT_17461 [Thamnocephalis sphaerospora]|uniref:Uncharacterized protein n=1 Tax=Thamnocephalis sphaerospora TaxID=78915 RepID=A0A4P9XMY5_9FUNG|nr:hypothetical protein THASP1DRAFT_17461 [Thamnocephalis sphaerospora]|eukprot:RKP07172.1 hypothetical protein THASP1DRAFT_17461 [Thamnocephalis sphaerospora]
MFGCLAAGRLVQTAPEQVDVGKFAFELADAGRVNHLVVFMTGAQPFDEGYGASVFLHWPGADWQILGMLCNDKPSAIFRLRDITGIVRPSAASDPAVTAVIGLSIEPLELIQQQLANAHPPTLPQPSQMAVGSTLPLDRVAAIGRRLLNYMHSYVTSYAKPLPNNVPGVVAMPTGAAGETDLYMHVKVFDDWWRSAERRLRTDPGFLTREE